MKNAIDQKLQLFLQTNQKDEPQRGPERKEYLQNENQKIVFAQAKKKLSSLERDYYCLAICFSDRGDNLSQWRGYGDDGCGISIGFDEQCIEELSKQHVLFRYDDVRYYSSTDDDDIQKKIEHYIDALDSIAINCTEKNRATAIKKGVQLFLITMRHFLNLPDLLKNARHGFALSVTFIRLKWQILKRTVIY